MVGGGGWVGGGGGGGFFFNDTATTEIYTLSLHDALPICDAGQRKTRLEEAAGDIDIASLITEQDVAINNFEDRKSTRLNSSHPSRSRMPSSA